MKNMTTLLQHYRPIIVDKIKDVFITTVYMYIFLRQITLTLLLINIHYQIIYHIILTNQSRSFKWSLEWCFHDRRVPIFNPKIFVIQPRNVLNT